MQLYVNKGLGTLGTLGELLAPHGYHTEQKKGVLGELRFSNKWRSSPKVPKTTDKQYAKDSRFGVDMASDTSQVKLVCSRHGDVPFLIVESGEYQRTYCLICFDEGLKRLGVQSVYPVKVEAELVEWPNELEVQ